MSTPELWIIAGPNGAGKTTCVQKEPISQVIPKVSFLNPDDRTLEKLKRAGFAGFSDAPTEVQFKLFRESADEVAVDLEMRIEAGIPVGVETVLSTDKYQQPVERVHSLNGRFYFIYVALSSPEIARQRVADRVSRGGHGVPNDKIANRWRRSLDNLPWYARRADSFWILDNSRSYLEGLPVLLASGRTGKIDYSAPAVFPEIEQVLIQLGR